MDAGIGWCFTGTNNNLLLDETFLCCQPAQLKSILRFWVIFESLTSFDLMTPDLLVELLIYRLPCHNVGGIFVLVDAFALGLERDRSGLHNATINVMSRPSGIVVTGELRTTVEHRPEGAPEGLLIAVSPRASETSPTWR